jgi:hypothetical protein
LSKNPLALAPMVVLALATPAFATEPGTPMDCSDLELAPGLSCVVELPDLPLQIQLRETTEPDNVGGMLNSSEEVLAQIGTCGRASLRRTALLRVRTGGAWQPLVVAQSRCLDPAITHFESIRPLGILFGSVQGSVYLGLVSLCFDDLQGPSCNYGRRTVWLARIDGFTPLADVLPPPPLPAPLCSNGLDDDGDGRIDAADAHCKSDADNDESRP